MTTTTLTVYANANFFQEKKNRKLTNILAKLTFLWYDNFGENRTPLHRNGMVAIPKILNSITFFKANKYLKKHVNLKLIKNHFEKINSLFTEKFLRVSLE